MKECAAKKGIQGNSCKGERVKTIGSDKIVGALFFHVFHAFSEAKNGKHEIDEVGECIDGLADEFVHICMLAKECAYPGFGRKPLPDHMAVVDGVEYGDDRCKYNSGYNG